MTINNKVRENVRPTMKRLAESAGGSRVSATISGGSCSLMTNRSRLPLAPRSDGQRQNVMRRRKLHDVEARATIKMAAFNVHRRAATWTKNKAARLFEFEAAPQQFFKHLRR